MHVHQEDVRYIGFAERTIRKLLGATLVAGALVLLALMIAGQSVFNLTTLLVASPFLVLWHWLRLRHIAESMTNAQAYYHSYLRAKIRDTKFKLSGMDDEYENSIDSVFDNPEDMLEDIRDWEADLEKTFPLSFDENLRIVTKHWWKDDWTDEIELYCARKNRAEQRGSIGAS